MFIIIIITKYYSGYVNADVKLSSELQKRLKKKSCIMESLLKICLIISFY